MITFQQGDIFTSACDALVNPVNCVGVSGKGLAREFKHRFPAGQEEYEQACKWKALVPGVVLASHRDWDKPWVLYLPTKVHWKNPSKEWYIEAGLWGLRAELGRLKHDIKSVAVPALGAGLGGLPWEWVREKMLYVFDTFPKSYRIDIYEPHTST